LFVPVYVDDIIVVNSSQDATDALLRDLEKELKDQRRRPEGGEWEPIKIPRWNLAYIPKLTQHTSLLTRSRLHSHRQVTSHRNRVGNPRITAETRARLWRQEYDQKSVQFFIVISPNTLRTCSGNYSVKPTRTRARLWRQESDQKSVQVIICISPNTSRMCSGNHSVKTIRTKKTQHF
jgi:hypothetical protein